MNGDSFTNTDFSILGSSSDDLVPIGDYETQTQVSGPDEHGLYKAVTILTIKDKEGHEKKFKLTRLGVSAAGKSGADAKEYVKIVAEHMIKNDTATKKVIEVGYARIGTGGRTEKVSYNYEGDGTIQVHKSGDPDKTLNINKFHSTASKTQFYETVAAIKNAPSRASLPARLTSAPPGKKSIYEKVQDEAILTNDDLQTITCFAKSGDQWYEAYGDPSSFSWQAPDRTRAPLKKPFPFQRDDSIALKSIDLEKKITKWRSKEKAFNTSQAVMKDWDKTTFTTEDDATFTDPLKATRTAPKKEPQQTDQSEKITDISDLEVQKHPLQTVLESELKLLSVTNTITPDIQRIIDEGFDDLTGVKLEKIAQYILSEEDKTIPIYDTDLGQKILQEAQRRKLEHGMPVISLEKVDKQRQQEARQKVQQLEAYYHATNRQTQIFSNLSEGHLNVDQLLAIERQFTLETKNMENRRKVAEILIDICDEATISDELNIVSYSTIENQLIWDFEQGCWEINDDHDRPPEELGPLLKDLVTDREREFLELMNKRLIEGSIITQNTIAELEKLRVKLLDPHSGIAAQNKALMGSRYNQLGLAATDPQQRKAYFELACDYGCNNAAINLAVMYEEGKGVEQNDERALEYFKRAITLNENFRQINPFNDSNIEAYEIRIATLEAIIASKQDSQVEADDSIDFEATLDTYLQKDIDNLIQLANKGDAIACYALGYIYYGGDTKTPEEVTDDEAQLAINYLKMGKDQLKQAAILLKTIERKEASKKAFKEACQQFNDLYDQSKKPEKIEREQVESLAISSSEKDNTDRVRATILDEVFGDPKYRAKGLLRLGLALMTGKEGPNTLFTANPQLGMSCILNAVEHHHPTAMLMVIYANAFNDESIEVVERALFQRNPEAILEIARYFDDQEEDYLEAIALYEEVNKYQESQEVTHRIEELKAFLEQPSH